MDHKDKMNLKFIEELEVVAKKCGARELKAGERYAIPIDPQQAREGVESGLLVRGDDGVLKVNEEFFQKIKPKE